MKLTTGERVVQQLSLQLPLRRRRLHLEKGALSITFDDFPKTAWQNGGAIVAQHGAKATYYTSGGLCGRFAMDVQQYDVGDLEAACAAGHEIGCHTFDHVSARRCPARDYVASIEQNRQFLCERLPGLALRTFAYPYGHATLGHRRSVSRLFAGARTVGCRLDRGTNGPMVDASALVGVGLWADNLRHHDLEALITEAAGRKRWVILLTHDVQERPSAHGCTPATLDKAISLARQAGLDIAPVGDILSRGGADASAVVH